MEPVEDEHEPLDETGTKGFSHPVILRDNRLWTRLAVVWVGRGLSGKSFHISLGLFLILPLSIFSNLILRNVI